MRPRGGFTLLELLVVLAVMSIMSGVALTSVRRTLASTRAHRAASVIAADLNTARFLAGRQRRPVRISIDTANRVFRVRDFTTPGTVYVQRHFHATSEFPLQRFSASDTSLIVYPNGLAAKRIDLTVSFSGESRVISMTRAGQVRVR